MPDTIQTLAAKQNGYPLLFNGYMARFAKLVKDYADSISGTPSHSVKFAGSQTSTNNATMTFTVTGAQTSDIVLATLKTQGASPVTILTARVSAANTVEIVWSAAPSTDHVFNYAILRAAS